MKASLFLLFVFFAVALCGRLATREYQQQCGSLRCEKSGEDCGSVDLKSYAISTACINADTEYCNVTQSGQGITVGQCIAFATEGQSCLNRVCGVGLDGCSLSSPTTTCVAVAQEKVRRLPGQPCGSSNIECRFSGSLGNEDTCENGVCKFTANGGSCNVGSTQCNYQSNCVGTFLSATCQARFASGSACIANISGTANTEASDAQCLPELNCIPTSTTDGVAGTCRAIYSQKEDGPCKSDADCKDGVCAPADGAVDTVYWGVCVDYKKTSTLNKRCADDNDCTLNNGESCVCVDDEKSVCKNTYFERKYYKDSQNYEECKLDADAKCGGLEYKQGLKCYLSECKKDFCKMYKNAKKEGSADFFTQQILDIVGGSNFDSNVMCAVVQVCDASALFTSLPLLIAFAAIVLLLQ